LKILRRIRWLTTADVFGFLCKRNSFFNLYRKFQMALFPTNATQVQQFAGALYGVQIGSTTLAQVTSDIQAAGGLNNALNAYYTASFGTSTTASVAATVTANLGLTGTAATAAADYITAVLNSTPASARGAAIEGVLNMFSNMTADATFGAAATAWNTKVAAAATYTGTANLAIGTIVAVNTPFTTGVDALFGSSGNDNFVAPAGTFNSLDSVDGGAGVDTLTVSLTAAYAGGVNVTGIEKLNINQTTAGGFNATGIAGLTDIATNASTVDIGVTGLASAANISVLNQDTAVSVTYVDAAVAGTSDAVTLTLNNVAQAAGTAIALNNTTATTGATGIETLNIVVAGLAGTSTNTVTVNSNATQSLTKVNVSGASAANLTLGTSLTTSALAIDASTMTGALTLNGMGAVTNNIKGGSGADTFAFAGNFTSADVVDGGAGVDTIQSTAANFAAITTADANVTNIETIRTTDTNIATATTINLANFGASNFRYAGDSASNGIVTVNGIATGGSVRIDGTVAAAADLLLNVTGATAPASNDTINLTLAGTSATHRATFTGVETLNVNYSNAVTAGTMAITDAALTTLVLTNTGSATIDTGTLGANVNSVNASAVTGGAAVAITLAGTANTGANVVGSAGADTVSGSDQGDVISTGAGNDSITGLAGGDQINVGTGTDTVVYTATAQTFVAATSPTSGTTVLTGVDVISGMGTGDVITMYAGATVTAATVVNTAVLTLGATSTVDAIAMVRGNYNATTGIWTTSVAGTDTLLQWDADGTTNGANSINDVVLVGFVGVATPTANTLTLVAA
jgi:hypothetical protein